jgi:hypothetical protein
LPVRGGLGVLGGRIKNEIIKKLFVLRVENSSCEGGEEEVGGIVIDGRDFGSVMAAGDLNDDGDEEACAGSLSNRTVGGRRDNSLKNMHSECSVPDAGARWAEMMA